MMLARSTCLRSRLRSATIAADRARFALLIMMRIPFVPCMALVLQAMHPNIIHLNLCESTVYASESGSVRPASAPHHGKAGEAHAEQCDGSRLGYEFGDHDLAVARPEIGDQDLVNARVEGAPTAAGMSSPRLEEPGTAAAVAATPASAATSATTTAEAAAEVATRETRERATAGDGKEGSATAGA